MVWKNQQSIESWLAWLWVSRYLKTPKIKPTIFLFLSCHYGFTNYFEILNFLFLISCQEEFQPVKYYLSRTSASKIWSSKNCKIQFFSLFDWFFFNFCLQNLWYFEEVPLKYPSQFWYYTEFIFRRACEKNSSPDFMFWLVGFQASKIWMFFWKIYCVAGFEIRNDSLKLPVFGFSNSLP